jgi:outer membrane protein assembly factor BamB
LASASAILADWPTHRGNPARTGNIDGQQGPQTPKVLWVYRSQDHFIASPVVGAKELFVSGLGAFNSSTLRALSLDKAAGKQELWSKGTPYLKLPVVSPPAVVDGKIVFGDGMHQTDGAVLHCLRADKGSMLWQLPLPGHLVHLESAPTIADGKVFIGGGNAGVLCVDFNRVTLEGKDLALAEVQSLLEKKWKELLEKYEADKKKDPDFAVPPTEDMLPKPAPKILWQQGKDNWHVDAPLTVVTGSVAAGAETVLAASARLDDEKIGERALFFLNAKTGQIHHTLPLTYNPWAGVTVTANNLIIIPGSSIRFDPQKLTEGRGEIRATNLAGLESWRLPVPGGVVSPVANTGTLLVFTATDGKVRAADAGNSPPAAKWTYDAAAPFFAGPAIAGGAVYVADLKGVVHALRLADGGKLWTLDLAADPVVKAPGMVYGSPVVHGGRLYVATCNLEGANARKPTAVVCIGEK